MENCEQSFLQKFNDCEEVIEDVLKDRLGDSSSAQRNEKLRCCIRELDSLSTAVQQLSLFSVNDELDELSTETLRFLLVLAYLACAFQEVSDQIGKRKVHLAAAKSYYRQFLQNVSALGLTGFKLPWLHAPEAENSNSSASKGIAASAAARQNGGGGYADAVARRQRTIGRIQQLEGLERTLDRLRIEQRRNDDDQAQRELIVTLLRFWSIRAVKELDSIEDELMVLEKMEARTEAGEQSSTNVEPIPIKTFIIARTEQQKKVFGLGYPSVPTMTVDEWYDQMQRSGGFGKGATAGPSSFNITSKREAEEEDEDRIDEAEEERRRKGQIQRDEWKDVNRRGWGNTYNKG